MLLPGLPDPLSGNLLPQDGSLNYLPQFYSAAEARELFSVLRDSIRWRQDKIRIYGRELNQPRLTAWYADEGKSYTYSGLTMAPDAWSAELAAIKQKVEAHCQRQFNSLLLNYYRDGNDHVSWHADNERELGPNPFIASLSLGGVRRFQLKHRQAELPPISLELETGSLVLMGGELQHHWVHRIAPTKKFAEARINLTFRTII